jgi:hypothetical protein
VVFVVLSPVSVGETPVKCGIFPAFDAGLARDVSHLI